MCLTQLSNCLTLEGSFSAVWTATIARQGALCSIFRALQDMHFVAPLESVEKKPNGEKQAETKREENAKRPRQTDPSEKAETDRKLRN